jgi:predicted RNA binding protein YcfA (HicA-like mRNA interferase family)
MPPFGPISRPQLIRYLRALGFEGPYTGGNHQYLIRGEAKLVLPSPHKGDISRSLLVRLLKQANVTREEWERL